MYKTHQVGITDPNGLCVMLKIPHHMYQKNGKLYAIDDKNCKVSDGPITACFAEILSSDELKTLLEILALSLKKKSVGEFLKSGSLGEAY